MSTRELQLRGDIRQAIENYLGDMVSGGGWEAVIDGVAAAIIAGQLDTGTAARIDLGLRATGVVTPDECPACHGAIKAEGMRW